MKISVVIPAFNEQEYLEACLKSLENQIEKPFETIVVNNNSIDKTVEIAKKFGAKVLHQKKPGTTPTRNKGFNAARGDIIARVDADTRVKADWTKRIRQAFEKDAKLLGLSGSAYFDKLPTFLQYHTWLATGSSGLVRLAMRHDGMMGFNLALRKKAWELVKNEVCLNDKDVHEDMDLAIHINKYGKVLFDRSLLVQTSSRRLSKAKTYVEYPYRYLKTVRRHKKLSPFNSNKRLRDRFSQSFFKNIVKKKAKKWITEVKN